MKHNKLKYLTDVLQAIDLARVHLEEIEDFEAFASNVTVKDAVIRRLTVIREALVQASKLDKTLAVSEIGKNHWSSPYTGS